MLIHAGSATCQYISACCCYTSAVSTLYLLQMGSVPFLSKLAGFKVSDTAAFQKGQQIVEDLKEKYETSDHPVVHKVWMRIELM